MIPGFGKIDMQKMNLMLKQMGIEQEEIQAKKVIIEKADNSKIIISNPAIQKIKMAKQESFQISGDVSEVQEDFLEEDIKLVAEKTGKTKKEALEALKKTNGDIAEAIMKLSE